MQIAGYDIKTASKKLVYLNNLSSKKRNDWRIKKKWDIAQFHFKNNLVYRKKVGKNFPKSWNALPIMHKNDYQKKIDYLISNGFDKTNVYLANTSGSSGHPFHFAKDKKAHALSWAFIFSRYLPFNKVLTFFFLPISKRMPFISLISVFFPFFKS
mgnify:CR=1 FL=1